MKLFWGKALEESPLFLWRWKITLYSIPHLSLTRTGFPVRALRKGFGLCGATVAIWWGFKIQSLNFSHSKSEILSQFQLYNSKAAWWVISTRPWWNLLIHFLLEIQDLQFSQETFWFGSWILQALKFTKSYIVGPARWRMSQAKVLKLP